MNVMKKKSGSIASIICLVLFFPVNSLASEQIISMKCALAIDAAFEELDSQINNPVTQQALSEISEKDGQFICNQPNDSVIYLRLENISMTAADNKLVLTVDARTLKVMKTYYGR